MCRSRFRPYDFRPSKQKRLWSAPAISAAISEVPSSILPPWGARMMTREPGRSTRRTRKSLPCASCSASSPNDAYLLMSCSDAEEPVCLNAQGIHRTVREHRRSEEPGDPEIIGTRREWESVESGPALLQVHHLLSHPLPEIRRER